MCCAIFSQSEFDFDVLVIDPKVAITIKTLAINVNRAIFVRERESEQKTKRIVSEREQNWKRKPKHRVGIAIYDNDSMRQ